MLLSCRCWLPPLVPPPLPLLGCPASLLLLRTL